MTPAAPLPLLLGLLMGLRHAFEPDHLAAVAAILSRSGGARAAKGGVVGLSWGAGHAFSVLLAGAGVIFLGWRIPLRFERGLECAAALVLIGLGGSILLRRLRGERAHLHLHEHDGLLHAHLHFHDQRGEEHRHHAGEALLSYGRRPFLVGALHGLSGSGGMTLLVLAATPSPSAALAALALFGLGALGGMAILSSILGLPLSRAARSSSRLLSALQIASGATSLSLGVVLVLRTLPLF
jgi:cytochrome c biogenesis protein CcdA